LTPNPTLVLIVIAAVAFMVSLSKGGLGGMLGNLATPILALVMPANQVIGFLLPIMLFADVFALVMHWKKWDGRLVWLLLPGAILGVTIGTVFIAYAPVRVLKTGLAIVAIVFVLFKLLEKPILGTLKYKARNWHGWLAGTLAGFSSSIAHNGGPPISIYLMLQGISPNVFVATLVLFFAILNWVKVPYYFYIGLFDFQKLGQLAWVFLIVPIGAWIGHWMASKISKKIFDAIIMALLVVAAVMLIIE